MVGVQPPRRRSSTGSSRSSSRRALAAGRTVEVSSVQPPLVPVRTGGPEELPALVCSVAAAGAPDGVVHLSGELDLATAPLLRSVLAEEIARGHRVLQVDLGGLTFCDLSGLSTLRWAQEQVQDAGGSLEVLHPSDFLRWLAGLCGFGDLLDGRA